MLGARWREGVRSSGRLRAARLLHDVSPGLAWALALLTIGGVAAATASRVLLGVMVGQVPDVIGTGLGSDAGDELLVTLAVVGVYLVVLDSGRIAETGTHADLVDRAGTYAELYELQARSYR